MTIEKFGRIIYNEKEVALKNIKTGEKIKRTILFSNMLAEDLQSMQEIHNKCWKADKQPSLGLSLKQFEPYFENFRDVSIAAVLVDVDSSGNPKEFIRVGGINPMRLNTKVNLETAQPERWLLTREDDVPITWNECTNYGYFDTQKSYGTSDRIWPCKNGDTIICPTVYAKGRVKLGEEVYEIGSLMKATIIAVKHVAEEISKKEERDIKIEAYSAPRTYDWWYKSYQDHGVPNLLLAEYYFASQANEKMLAQEKFCKENKIEGKERLEQLYNAYTNSGGFLSFPEFEKNDIAYYALLGIGETPGVGRTSYLTYKKKFGPIDVEKFLSITGRRLIDGVIGRHVSFGAMIGKIIENGREDPTSMNYNTLMIYPSIVVKKEVKNEVVNQGKPEKVEESTM